MNARTRMTNSPFIMVTAVTRQHVRVRPSKARDIVWLSHVPTLRWLQGTPWLGVCRPSPLVTVKR
jgi:hypothetical protein